MLKIGTNVQHVCPITNWVYPAKLKQPALTLSFCLQGTTAERLMTNCSISQQRCKKLSHAITRRNAEI
ncbi:hypothetical protein EUGRSUZ_G00247 [Eucalyptus grandis]|uniref:Uncharacterized protein n=2 Tax=Eucalyptus grandis TaxID=71139 RepID=A0ACC3JZZ7_EUCGR|nr:hypothetical protein EUGRSUZ_G00247 [Eucalyptus grandis]